MRTKTKPVVILLVADAFLAVVGAGRRTAPGYGKDMQNAGESIQSGTE